MTINENDLLERISDSVDQDEILERLNLETSFIVDKFKEEILDNLEKFDDIYDGDLEDCCNE